MLQTYIVRFSKPLNKPNRFYGDEWHYVGITKHLGYREQQHIHGSGSKATSRAVRAGAKLSIVYNCVGDKERQITANISAFCSCDVCVQTRKLEVPFDLVDVSDKYGD